VESKGFADRKTWMKLRTVCTDGDHPLLPSCLVALSRL
jgi:hypothetical protein